MAAEDVRLRRGGSLVPGVERLEENRKPLLRLRVPEGRVQARERGVRYDLDGPPLAGLPSGGGRAGLRARGAAVGQGREALGELLEPVLA